MPPPNDSLVPVVLSAPPRVAPLPGRALRLAFVATATNRTPAPVALARCVLPSGRVAPTFALERLVDFRGLVVGPPPAVPAFDLRCARAAPAVRLDPGGAHTDTVSAVVDPRPHEPPAPALPGALPPVVVVAPQRRGWRLPRGAYRLAYVVRALHPGSGAPGALLQSETAGSSAGVGTSAGFPLGPPPPAPRPPRAGPPRAGPPRSGGGVSVRVLSATFRPADPRAAGGAGSTGGRLVLVVALRNGSRLPVYVTPCDRYAPQLALLRRAPAAPGAPNRTDAQPAPRPAAWLGGWLDALNGGPVVHGCPLLEELVQAAPGGRWVSVDPVLRVAPSATRVDTLLELAYGGDGPGRLGPSTPAGHLTGEFRVRYWLHSPADTAEDRRGLYHRGAALADSAATSAPFAIRPSRARQPG